MPVSFTSSALASARKRLYGADEQKTNTRRATQLARIEEAAFKQQIQANKDAADAEEAAAKDAAKLAKAEAEARLDAENDATEAQYRRDRRPMYVDSQSRIRPVDTDEVFAAKQAEKGRKLQAEKDKKEQEAREKAELSKVAADEAVVSENEQLIERNRQRQELERDAERLRLKKIEDDYKGRLKAFDDMELPMTEQQQQATKTKLEQVKKRLTDLDAQAIAKKKEALTFDTAQDERKALLRKREAAIKRGEAPTPSPEPLIADPVEFEQSAAQHQVEVEQFNAEQAKQQAKMADLERENERLMSLPHTAADVSEDGKWHKDVIPAVNALNDVVQSRSPEVQAKQQRLQEQARVLGESATAMNAQAKAANEQAKAEQAAARDAAYQDFEKVSPGMGREYLTLLDDQDRRAAALRTKYAGREDSTEAKAAFDALEQDITGKLDGLQGKVETAQKSKSENLEKLWNQFGAGDLGTATMRDWVADKSTDPEYDKLGGVSSMPANFKAKIKELGLDEKEARNYMETRRQLDWSSPLDPEKAEKSAELTRPLREKLGITDMLEPVRRLPNGAIIPNPVLGGDEEAFKKTIEATDGTPEQKAEAMQLWPSYRRQYGEGLLAAFAKQSAFGTDFNEWRDHLIEEDQKVGGKNGFAAMDAVDQALMYQEQMKGRSFFRRWADLIASNVTAGFMDVTQAALGSSAAILGAVPGIGKGLSEMAGANAENAASLVNTQDQLSNTGLAGSIAATIARMAPGVAATVGTGSMAGGMIFGGAQTAGSLYGDAYNTLRDQGKSHMEAWKASAPASLAAGAMTAGLTKLFPGGVTALANNPEARASVRAMVAGFMSSGKAIAKGALDEIPEEVIDEAMSQLAQGYAEGRNPDDVVRDFITGLPELVVASGLMGGGMQALKDRMDRKAGGTPPATAPDIAPKAPTGPLPEAKAGAQAAITAFNPTDPAIIAAMPDAIKGKNTPAPQVIARAKVAAQALTDLAQGKDANSLSPEEKTALGIKVNPKTGEVLPASASVPALAQTVARADKDGNITHYLIIADAAREWLQNTIPDAGEMIQQTAAERIKAIDTPKPPQAKTPRKRKAVTTPKTVGETVETKLETTPEITTNEPNQEAPLSPEPIRGQVMPESRQLPVVPVEQAPQAPTPGASGVAANLTPAQAEQLAKARADYDSAMRSANADPEPEIREKKKKAAGMRFAAAKRQIIGNLTGKEAAAKAKREASNFEGKLVTVDGRKAEVIGNAFGKVKVKFEDGTQAFVTADKVKPQTDTKADIPATETADPANDPIVGVDINGTNIQQTGQGTYYTFENGRVRTGPAFTEPPAEVDTKPATGGELIKQAHSRMVAVVQSASEADKPKATAAAKAILDGLRRYNGHLPIVLTDDPAFDFAWGRREKALIINPETALARFVGDSTDAENAAAQARQFFRHELIHKFVVSQLGDARVMDIWGQLPKEVQDQVQKAYSVRLVARGQKPKKLNPDHGGHEYYRAMLEAMKDGTMTEQVIGKDLADKWRKFLDDVLSLLRDLRKQFASIESESARNDLIKQVDQDIKLVSDALDAFEKSISPGVESAQTANTEAGSTSGKPVEGSSTTVATLVSRKREKKSSAKKEPESPEKPIIPAVGEKTQTIAGLMDLNEFEAKGYAPEQVTRADWVALQRAERRRLGQPEQGDNKNAPWAEYEEFHRDAVERAVKAGEEVDSEVLTNYPWLQAEVNIRPYVESLRGMPDAQLKAEEKSTAAELNAIPKLLGDRVKFHEVSERFNAVNREIEARKTAEKAAPPTPAEQPTNKESLTVAEQDEGDKALADAFTGLFASPTAKPLSQADLPKDRRDAMMKAASVLVDVGVKSPAELAQRLDKLAPNGALRQYTRAFWRLMSGFDSTLEENPHWPTVYAELDQPAEVQEDQDEANRLAGIRLEERFNREFEQKRPQIEALFDEEGKTWVVKNGKIAKPGGIQERWTPDELKQMVAKFRDAGLAASVTGSSGQSMKSTFALIDTDSQRMFGTVMNERAAQASAAAKLDAQQQDQAKKQGYLAEADQDALQWMNQTFGEDFANEYNKKALSDFLTGKAAKFSGMVSQRWTDGVKALGAIADAEKGTVDFAAIKKAYENSSRPPSVEGVTGPSSEQGAAPASDSVPVSEQYMSAMNRLLRKKKAAMIAGNGDLVNSLEDQIEQLRATVPMPTQAPASANQDENAIISNAFRAHFGQKVEVTKILPGLFKAGKLLYGLYNVSKLTNQQVLNGIPIGDEQMLVREEDEESAPVVSNDAAPYASPLAQFVGEWLSMNASQQSRVDMPQRVIRLAVNQADTEAVMQLVQDVGTKTADGQLLFNTPHQKIYNELREALRYTLRKGMGTEKDKVSTQLAALPDLSPPQAAALAKEVTTPEKTKEKKPTDTKALRAMKTYLLEKLDDAIAAAPDEKQLSDARQDLVALMPLYDKSKTLKVTQAMDGLREKYGLDATAKKEDIDAAIRSKIPENSKVVIEIPGDGTFTLWNDKKTLQNFAKIAKGFPTTTPSADTPTLNPIRPSGIPTLKSGKLGKADVVKVAGMFASTDETRQALMQVADFGDVIVATNGKMLFTAPFEGFGKADDPMLFNVKGNKLGLQSENEKLDKFPPGWKAVVPVDLPTIHKGIDTGRLWQILKQASSLARDVNFKAAKGKGEDVTSYVAISINQDGSLGVKSQVLNNQNLETYEHNIQEGGDPVGSFDAELLMDALAGMRALGHEKVAIKSGTERGEGPIMLSAPDADIVIMRVRAQAVEPTMPERDTKVEPETAQQIPAENRSARDVWTEEYANYLAQFKAKGGEANSSILNDVARKAMLIEVPPDIVYQDFINAGVTASKATYAVQSNWRGWVVPSAAVDAIASEAAKQGDRGLYADVSRFFASMNSDYKRSQAIAALKSGEITPEQIEYLANVVEGVAKVKGGIARNVAPSLIARLRAFGKADSFAPGQRVTGKKNGDFNRTGTIDSSGPTTDGERTWFVQTDTVGSVVYKESELTPEAVEVKPDNIQQEFKDSIKKDFTEFSATFKTSTGNAHDVRVTKRTTNAQITNRLAGMFSKLGKADEVVEQARSFVDEWNRWHSITGNVSGREVMVRNANDLAKNLPSAAPVVEETAPEVETPPEPATTPVITPAKRTKKTIAKIEDVGEKIGGARKDRWKERGLAMSDYDGLTDTEKQAYTNKAQVFPKPDYQALIDGGMDKPMAYALKEVYDSIAPKPNLNRAQQADPAQRDAALRLYVDTVGKIRDGLKSVKTPEELKALRNDVFTSTPTGYGGRSEYSADAKAAMHLVSTGKRRYELPGAMEMTGYDLRNIARKLEKLPAWPAPQEQWQRMFDIRRIPIGSVLSKKLPDGTWEKTEVTVNTPPVWQVTKDYRILSEHSSQEAAEAWAKAAAVKSRKEDPKRPYNPDVKRTGEDYRKGRDVTGEELLAEFGFRGAEFGLWTNDGDRQQSLNQAFDGLHDLARILNVPPKAISLNGELGIAFGARGSGKFAAHYEPSRVVINLTKTSGAGALAHEWAHAMDDYFGRMATSGQSGKYVSHGAKGTEAFRAELAATINEVMKAISERQWTAPEYIADLKERNATAQKKTDSWLKSVERSTEKVKLTPEQKDEVDTYTMQLRGQRMPEALVNGRPDMTQVATKMLAIIDSAAKAQKIRVDWPVTGGGKMSDLAAGLGRHSGMIFATNNDLARAEAGDLQVPNRTVPTNTLKASQEQGDYWQRKHELFARSFEAFVEDSIRREGNQSPYLVGFTADSGAWGNLYPQGDERAATNEAFQKMVDTLKTRETDKGVALFASPTAPARPIASVIQSFDAAFPTFSTYMDERQTPEARKAALRQIVKAESADVQAWREFANLDPEQALPEDAEAIREAKELLPEVEKIGDVEGQRYAAAAKGRQDAVKEAHAELAKLKKSRTTGIGWDEAYSDPEEGGVDPVPEGKEANHWTLTPPSEFSNVDQLHYDIGAYEDGTVFSITKSRKGWGDTWNEYPTLAQAKAAAEEDFQKEAGEEWIGVYGSNLDSQEAIKPIFDHFTLPDGVEFQPGTAWGVTKWGSWYAHVRGYDVKRGEVRTLKLSVRDHDASRKDMGLPDLTSEVSKNWTPEEVAAALERLEQKVANRLQSIEDTDAPSIQPKVSIPDLHAAFVQAKRQQGTDSPTIRAVFDAAKAKNPRLSRQDFVSAIRNGHYTGLVTLKDGAGSIQVGGKGAMSLLPITDAEIMDAAENAAETPEAILEAWAATEPLQASPTVPTAFEEQLESQQTLDLENDQVSIPKFNADKDTLVESPLIDGVHLMVRNRGEVADYGPHEFFFNDNDDNILGFARLTKSPKEVSINLIYVDPDRQGQGIGSAFYKYWLDQGISVKSDAEITDGTAELYKSLVRQGYGAAIENNRAVLKPMEALQATPTDKKPRRNVANQASNLPGARDAWDKLSQTYEDKDLETVSYQKIEAAIDEVISEQAGFDRLYSQIVGKMRNGIDLSLEEDIARRMIARVLWIDGNDNPASRTKAKLLFMADMREASETARKLGSRVDKVQTPQQRLDDAMRNILSPSSKMIHERLVNVWSGAEKLAAIKELERRLASTQDTLQRERAQRELEKAKARQDQNEVMEQMAQEDDAKVDAILKRNGLTQTDLFLSVDDRYAMQEAVLALARVHLSQQSEAHKKAIEMSVRGYSDNAIAKETGLPVAEVSNTAEHFRNVVAKQAISKQVSKGGTFSKMISAGKSILSSILRASPTAPLGSMVAKGTPSAAAVAAQIQAILNASIPTKGQRNAMSLHAATSKGKNGQNVKVFVPYNPADWKQVYRMARELSTREATWLDKGYEYWINGILSGPQTHVVNTASNVLSTAWAYGPQWLADATANVAIRNPNSPQFGEFKHIWAGFYKGIMPALRNFALAWNTEADPVEHQYLDKPVTAMFQSGNLDKVGGIRPSIGIGGRYVRMPGRFLVAQDAFAKTLIMHAESAAMAYRLGKKQGLAGAALENFMASQIATHGSESWQHAFEKAVELTFQDENDITKAVEGVSNALKRAKFVGFLFKYLLPFVRTPTNIYRAGIRKAGGSAGMLLYRLGKLGYYAIKGNSNEFRSYREGAMVKDVSESVMALALWFLVMGMSEGDDDDGQKTIEITGSRPFGVANAGERASQFRQEGGSNLIIIRKNPITGKKLDEPIEFAYGRYEPIALALSTLVDGAREFKEWTRFKPEDRTTDKLGGSIMRHVLAQAKEKTFLQGVSGVLQFIEDAGSNNFSGKDLLMKNLMNGAIPNLIRQPYKLIQDEVADAKKANSELSRSLGIGQPKVNEGGKPVTRQGNVVSRVLFPVASQPSTDLFDAALKKWNTTNPDQQWNPDPLTKADLYVYGPKVDGKMQQVPLKDSAKITKFEREIGQKFADYSARKLMAAGWKPGKPVTPQMIEAIKKIRTDSIKSVRASMGREERFGTTAPAPAPSTPPARPASTPAIPSTAGPRTMPRPATAEDDALARIKAIIEARKRMTYGGK